jgi:hypothetical protein
MFLHENQVWKPIGEYVKALLYPLLLGSNNNLSIGYVVVLKRKKKKEKEKLFEDLKTTNIHQKNSIFIKKLKPIVFLFYFKNKLIGL